MEQYIPKSALVAEIERLRKNQRLDDRHDQGVLDGFHAIERFIDTLEVKEVDLIIHTIIAECCDWLAMNTNLSHNEIEDCRNLMLTVKEEQFKIQKGEEV